ncbi:MAG TPA: hypothetical protein EYF93_05815, partial [Planctomycetes bacterium]|nr:hypothetical protein [Planctomycetota bacterium]
MTRIPVLAELDSYLESMIESMTQSMKMKLRLPAIARGGWLLTMLLVTTLVSGQVEPATAAEPA